MIICTVCLHDKCWHSSSFSTDSHNINVRIYALITELFRLRKQRAVFTNHIMTAEYYVLRRFTLSCACVNICAHKPCRLPLNKLTPVSWLSYCLIASRAVYKKSCAMHGVLNSGRLRRPQVLTDFGADYKPSHIFTSEKLISTKRNLFIINIYRNTFFKSRCELASLVKFAIIGKTFFWNKP